LLSIDDSAKCTILYVPAFEAGRVLVYDACLMAKEILDESYVNPWIVGGASAAVIALLCAGGIWWNKMPKRETAYYPDVEIDITKAGVAAQQPEL
jgi:hypothetical protein